MRELKTAPTANNATVKESRTTPRAMSLPKNTFHLAGRWVRIVPSVPPPYSLPAAIAARKSTRIPP